MKQLQQMLAAAGDQTTFNKEQNPYLLVSNKKTITWTEVISSTKKPTAWFMYYTINEKYMYNKTNINKTKWYTATNDNHWIVGSRLGTDSHRMYQS